MTKKTKTKEKQYLVWEFGNYDSTQMWINAIDKEHAVAEFYKSQGYNGKTVRVACSIINQQFFTVSERTNLEVKQIKEF